LVHRIFRIPDPGGIAGQESLGERRIAQGDGTVLALEKFGVQRS
jgi:hypothetical protein